MNNCLLTTLKGSVNNDALPVFNAMKCRLTKQNSRSYLEARKSGVWYIGGNGVVFKPVSNVKLVVNGSDVLTEYEMKDTDTTINISLVSDSTYGEFYLLGLTKIAAPPVSSATNNALLQVDDPMRIHLYKDQTLTPSVLYPIAEEPYNLGEYINSIMATGKSSITAPRFFGRVDYAYSTIEDWEEWTGLIAIDSDLNITSGDIKNLPNALSITNFTLNKPGITGDVKYLGKYIAMVNAIGESSPVGSTTLNGSSIYGTVEELVAAYYANGKKSGFVRIYMTDTTITFNGNRLPASPRMVTVTWSDGGSAPSNITLS